MYLLDRRSRVLRIGPINTFVSQSNHLTVAAVHEMKLYTKNIKQTKINWSQTETTLQTFSDIWFATFRSDSPLSTFLFLRRYKTSLLRTEHNTCSDRPSRLSMTRLGIGRLFAIQLSHSGRDTYGLRATLYILFSFPSDLKRSFPGQPAMLITYNNIKVAADSIVTSFVGFSSGSFFLCLLLPFKNDACLFILCGLCRCWCRCHSRGSKRKYYF